MNAQRIIAHIFDGMSPDIVVDLKARGSLSSLLATGTGARPLQAVEPVVRDCRIAPFDGKNVVVDLPYVHDSR